MTALSNARIGASASSSWFLHGPGIPARARSANSEERAEVNEEEDEGDEWIKSIVPCSAPGVQPDHVHIKVTTAEEKGGKRRFF